MKSDDEDKWYFMDYFIPEDELAEEAPPARSWLTRHWLLLAALVLVVGAIAAVLAWQWQTRLANKGPAQISKNDMGLIEDQLREILLPRQIGEDPSQRQVPAELMAKAKLLLAQGNDEQSVLAKIALKNDSGADFALNALKQEPIAQAFRLLTLEGHNWYNAGEFDRAVKFYEQALALQPEDADALRNAAIAHSQAKQGDITAHWRRAVELLQQGIDQTASGSPLWCELQNNLGLAWMEFPNGDHLKQAIAAFHAAQDRFSCGGNQMLWAKIQNNLGSAWLKFTTGDRVSNLHSAIAAFRSALEVYDSKKNSLEWATAQNNLGTALMALTELRPNEASENLGQAEAVFRSALEVFARGQHPLEWADAQNNLGLVLDRLPDGDLDGNRKQAIAAFQAAEKSYSRTLHPEKWASIRFNQAVALKHLAETAAKGCDPLWQSMAYLKAAASVWTQEAFPVPRQNQIEPFEQALRKTWQTRNCGPDKMLDGIPAAK